MASDKSWWLETKNKKSQMIDIESFKEAFLQKTPAEKKAWWTTAVADSTMFKDAPNELIDLISEKLGLEGKLSSDEKAELDFAIFLAYHLIKLEHDKTLSHETELMNFLVKSHLFAVKEACQKEKYNAIEFGLIILGVTILFGLGVFVGVASVNPFSIFTFSVLISCFIAWLVERGADKWNTNPACEANRFKSAISKFHTFFNNRPPLTANDDPALSENNGQVLNDRAPTDYSHTMTGKLFKSKGNTG